MLKIGSKVPLRIKLDGGKSLAECLGGWVVLYFYPKDDTPGCTVEAEGFRDIYKKIAQGGARVVGVSKDNEKSHEKFTRKYDLPFELWSDTEHKLMDAFGVWGERKFMGRTYMGVSRSTFLIDPNGKVSYVWEKVTPKGHAQDVLYKIAELS